MKTMDKGKPKQARAPAKKGAAPIARPGQLNMKQGPLDTMGAF